jgi:myo-inositol-1(or 4)-monophosphatase
MDWLKICQDIGKNVQKEVMKVYGTSNASATVGKGAGGHETMNIDKIAEDLVVGHFKKLGGNFKIYSEECGEVVIGNPEYYIIVDPVDGSFNTKIGFDYFGLSIAVFKLPEMKQLFGFVKNLANGNEFYADEKGAYKNGEKIRSSSNKELRNLMLECSPKATVTGIEFLAKSFIKSRHARAPGAVALDLCRVADGSFDCLLYAGSSRFLDVAAGIFIAKKAGCLVTDFEGSKELIKGDELVAKSLLVCSNQDIFDELVEK